MSFILSLTPLLKGRCTSGKLLLTILVFLTVSTVSSLPNKVYECPNCSGKFIKTVDPITGKCVECWPCIECGDGSGSSVPCGATVPVGTKINCVLCVNGANFSDSHSTDQCQPCGLCAGEHEHVLNKCTHESDVKCDCKEGFYRNKTNDKCHPCSSCPSCLRDEDIFSKCQKAGQQMARSSTTMHSTSLVPALVTSSYSHYTTPMSLPPDLTITRVLVPTRTQQISATSTSIFNYQKNETMPTSKPTEEVRAFNQIVHVNSMNGDHTHESKKTEIIIITVLSIACVCLFVCLLYHKLRNSRTRRLNDEPVRFLMLNRGAIEGEQENNGKGNSCETSSNRGSVPDLSSSLSGSSEDMFDRTVDSAQQDSRVIAGDHPDHAAAIEAQKGIPSSLEGEQGNFITQGHINQPCDLPEDSQDGLFIAAKDGTVVLSDNMDARGDMRHKMPSGNNTVNVFLNVPALPQLQRGTAAVPPLADFTSTSGSNNWVISAPSLRMPVPVNQGTISALSSIVVPTAQSAEANRGYATHITHVPLRVIYEMCKLLDLDRTLTDGNDYTRLGSELGLDSTQIQTLKQKCDNPSYVILTQVFSAKPNSGTIEHLIPLLEKMGRHDVIKVIDTWVDDQK